MTQTITKPKTVATKKGVVKQVSPIARALKCAAQAIGMTPTSLTTG
jgi:hypothetical protein